MKPQSAYTLIEVIVVMAVTTILAGVGLTSLNTINRRQKLVQNVKALVADLRLTKSLADSQQKPVDCGTQTLNGYRLLIIDDDTITISAKCDDDYYQYKSRITTARLDGLTEIFYPVLHQPVEFFPAVADQKIIVTQNGQNITISIEETGAVNYE